MAARKLAVFANLGEDIRTELQPVLSELGLAMVSAQDDVEALRLVDAEKAGMVLAEASTGIVLCMRLRQEESTGNLPIVLIGAEEGREARLAALRAGADEFLCEPLDHEDVRLRLNALLLLALLQSS